MKKRLSAMKICYGCVLLLAFFVCAPQAQAAVRLSGPVALSDDNPSGELLPTGEAVLVSDADGKEASLEVFLGSVRHSPLFYAALNAEEAAAIGKSGPVLFLFAKDGSLAGELPRPGAADCQDAAASPQGDILAVDEGQSASRTWTFYSFPGLARIGEQLGYARESQSGETELVWAGDAAVLFPVREQPENRGRDCRETDGCGRLSVFLHRIRTGETVPVVRGTPLCDYRLTSFADGMAFVEQICAPTPEGWWKMENGQFPEYRQTETKVPLPGGQRTQQ